MTLDALAPALEAHLHEEEREVLPLIEQHLTVKEWNELGERAVAAIQKGRLLVLLGYIVEEASPSERQTMLRVLPPPARFVYKTIGRRKQVKERDRIRAGTLPAQRPAVGGTDQPPGQRPVPRRRVLQHRRPAPGVRPRSLKIRYARQYALVVRL